MKNKIYEILKRLTKRQRKDSEVITHEIKYFKYNSDDILEILTESLAQENGFSTFSAKSNLIYDDDKIWFIGVIGELDDEAVDSTDLTELYKNMEHNGFHTDKVWNALNDETP